MGIYQRLKRRIVPWGGMGLLVTYGIVGGYYATYAPEVSRRFVWGAYHVHSRLSDGLSTLEEIAEQAREARVDFVLLTEHGWPHRDASTLDENHGGVRFIGGSEVGLAAGHLNFFGAKSLPDFNLPPFPPDAVADIEEWGAFSVMAYPEDPEFGWQYWEEDFRPNGTEILNVSSYLRSMSLAQRLWLVAFAPFSHYHLLSLLPPPQIALRRWDEFLTRSPVFALHANNAHGGFTIADRIDVPVPSYEVAFSLVGLAVARRHQTDPVAALRRGEFFAVVRGAGEPQDVDFHAELGGERFPMGSSLSGEPRLALDVETLDLRTRLVLLKDGRTVVEQTGSSLRFDADSPGVYRAEIYLEGHPLLGRDVPWILSNPIFIDAGFLPPRDASVGDPARQAVELRDLTVETDRHSAASFGENEPDGVFRYRLSQSTRDDINRWCALALRRDLRLSSFEGFYIEATSPDYMRYWIELRGSQTSHFASLKFYPDEPMRLHVPFDRFYRVNGPREPPVLDEIVALFLIVNTSNSRTGFSSSLTIDELGFYRNAKTPQASRPPR